MPQVGVSLAPSKQLRLESVVELAKLAESLDYDSIWVPETWGADAVSVLAILAGDTKKIRIASGVLNVYSRSAALIAQTAATLQDVSDGRFILGLGTSGPKVVEDWHGVPYRWPLQRTREYIEAIRLALAGRTVNVDGHLLQLHDFTLQNSRKEVVPIYIAALGDKNLQLTGEIADGWLPIFAPRGHMQSLLFEVEKGARSTGRSLSDIAVAAYLPAMVGNRAERLLSHQIAYYVGGMGSFYAQFFRRIGFADEADAIAEKWRSGDRAGAELAVTQELLDVFTVGTVAEQARARIGEYRAEGVGLVVLVPPKGANALEIADTLEVIKKVAAYNPS